MLNFILIAITFAPPVHLPTSQPSSLAAFFDGDLRPDAGVGDVLANEVLVFFNDSVTEEAIPLAGGPALLMIAIVLAAVAVMKLR